MARFRFYVDVPDEQIRWAAHEAGISFTRARDKIRTALEIAADMHLYREPRVDEDGYLSMVEPDDQDPWTYSGAHVAQHDW